MVRPKAHEDLSKPHIITREMLKNVEAGRCWLAPTRLMLGRLGSCWRILRAITL